MLKKTGKWLKQIKNKNVQKKENTWHNRDTLNQFPLVTLILKKPDTNAYPRNNGDPTLIIYSWFQFYIVLNKYIYISLSLSVEMAMEREKHN